MQNIVRNLSHKLSPRRPGHDMEAGSMAGTTINSSSHFIGSHSHNSGNAHSHNIQPHTPVAGGAPTYRPPPYGVVPRPGMRGALYTHNTRLIVKYVEPLHRERMEYDPSNPDEPQVCFQLPMPTEFKPDTVISMFILGEPVCAVVQEATPDGPDVMQGPVGQEEMSVDVEWEPDEEDGEEAGREEEAIHTQDGPAARNIAAVPTQQTGYPATLIVSPMHKFPPRPPRGSNSSLPRKGRSQRKQSIKSLLKVPFSFFVRKGFKESDGTYRENAVLYPDSHRASLAEGGIERMLLGVDEGVNHDSVDPDRGHARGEASADGVQEPLSKNPDANSSLLTLAAKKILERDAPRIESWAEKHPHRSFPPLAPPAPQYPTHSAAYGGDAHLPSRSISPYSSARQTPVPLEHEYEPVISRFRESFDTLRLEAGNLPPIPAPSPPPNASGSAFALPQSASPRPESAAIASPASSPAVSLPRHPGAAQATLVRRDTYNSHRSGRRSEDTIHPQQHVAPVRRHASNASSAPQRHSSQRRDPSSQGFDVQAAVAAAARARAKESAQNEQDLRNLQKHLASTPTPAAPFTEHKRSRKRTLSASGIRSILGNAISRISNPRVPPQPHADGRQRASSLSATPSASGDNLHLPEIAVGETDSWRYTFAPFLKPHAIERTATPPLLFSAKATRAPPPAPLQLDKARSSPSKERLIPRPAVVHPDARPAAQKYHRPDSLDPPLSPFSTELTPPPSPVVKLQPPKPLLGQAPPILPNRATSRSSMSHPRRDGTFLEFVSSQTTQTLPESPLTAFYPSGPVPSAGNAPSPPRGHPKLPHSLQWPSQTHPHTLASLTAKIARPPVGSNDNARTPATFTSMYPTLPSRRDRGRSTITTDTAGSRMTTGSTHAMRQLSRNMSKQKPLPDVPNSGSVRAHRDSRGNSPSARNEGAWNSYAVSPPPASTRAHPISTSSPHMTGQGKDNDDRRHPPVQQAESESKPVSRSPSHAQGTQHTRFVAPDPHAHPSKAFPPPRTEHPTAYRFPSARPPDPSPPKSGPPMAIKTSKSGSTAATSESALEGYQTAPSIPSISDAFDKSSYRADSRAGRGPSGQSSDEDGSDDDSSSDTTSAHRHPPPPNERQTAPVTHSDSDSDSGSDSASEYDSDHNQDVDNPRKARRRTDGSWAIPPGDVDAHGNERAAILSGDMRVFVARPRERPPPPAYPMSVVRGGARGGGNRGYPTAQEVLDIPALAMRPQRPDPARDAPPGQKHPARF